MNVARTGGAGALALALMLGLLTSCQDTQSNKIKLSAGSDLLGEGVESAASVLRVEVSERSRIGISDFENQTGDQSLDWLQRGLSDMLVAELDQTPFLTVVALGREQELPTAGADDFNPLGEAPRTSRQELTDLALSGRYTRDQQGFRIEAELRDTRLGSVLHRESIPGAGLENVFSMINELASRLVERLAGQLARPEPARLGLAEMTDSLEAFEHYSKGREYREKFFIAEARQEFQRAVELDPAFAAAHLELAKTMDSEGARRKAMAALDAAAQHLDRLSDLDRLMLKLHRANLEGNVKLLLQARKQLWQQAPDDVDARMELAHALFSQGEHERALEEYELIVDLDPKRKLAYNMLGYLHGMRGDLRTALRYLDEYERLAPDEPNPNDSQGEILMAAGHLEEAIAPLEQALRKRPDFHYSAKRLSQIYSELGSLERSLSYSDRWLDASATDTERAVAHIWRGAQLWRFGRLDEAREALEHARELAPNVMASTLVLGKLLRAQGLEEQARDLYRSSIDSQIDSGASSEWHPWKMVEALNFVADSGLGFDQQLAWLARLREAEKRPEMREVIGFYTSLTELRAGRHGEHGSCLGAATPELLTALTQLPGGAWQRLWRRVAEAAQLEPEAHARKLCDSLAETAELTGRKELEALVALIEAGPDRQQQRAVYSRYGAPLESDWLLLGPFENRSGFLKDFGPEQKLDLGARYQGIDGKLEWQTASEQARDGYVDLAAEYGDPSWAVAYGTLAVHSPVEQIVSIRLEIDGAGKLWLNDDLIWQAYYKKGYASGPDVVKVVLRKGQNRLLLKLAGGIGHWGYTLRITDEQDRAVPGIEFLPAAGRKLAQR